MIIKPIKRHQTMNDRREFKLELDMAHPEVGIYPKYFNSLKSLNQWLKRNEDTLFTCVETRKYILTANGYERFHVFGNVVVPLSELDHIISNIRKNEEEKAKFIEDLKKLSLRFKENEETESSIT